MEARERLARVVAPKAWLPEAFNAPYGGIYATQRGMSLDIASIVLSSLHLSDTAALALMDDPGIGQKLSMAMTFKQEIARRPQGVAAYPYKENPDDPR